MTTTITHPSGATRVTSDSPLLPGPKAVTLFSGVGGSSKALRDLGYDVLAHDFMKEACQSLDANGFWVRECDVRTVDWTHEVYADTEILEGGPPCQPFSQSHDGAGQYDPRDMIPEFLRAIDGLQPKLFVMEEVQTLTWKKHAAYFAMVLDHMRALGYRVEHRVVNSKDFGIGQARKRLIVIGVREDVAQGREAQAVWFAEQGYGDDIVAPIMWPSKDDYAPVTMAEALDWTRETCIDRNRQVPDERAVVPYGDERALWPLTRAAVTVVGSFRPEVAAAPGYRKAGDPPRQGTPGSVVTTLEERLILQDFPADWIVCGSEQKRDLQVGNSVPVGMMRDIIDINIP